MDPQRWESSASRSHVSRVDDARSSLESTGAQGVTAKQDGRSMMMRLPTADLND